MTTLQPVIALAHADNKRRVDYLQSVANAPNFEYPPVCLSGYVLLYD